MDADTAAQYVTKTILHHAEECIGKRSMQEVKSTHPWLTPEIVQMTAEKREAEGADNERELIESCSAKILETRRQYEAKMRK